MVDENGLLMEGIEHATVAPLLVGDVLQKLTDLDFGS